MMCKNTPTKKRLYASTAGHQHGLALVQVLLMTGIIALLMTIILFNTKSNQNKVLMAEAHFEQELLVSSRLAEAKFALATVNWRAPAAETGSRSDFVDNWNFYGQSFQVRGVHVSIQNLQSLPSLRQPENIHRLLIDKGVENEYAESLVDILRRQQRMSVYDDFTVQSGPLPVQSLGELVALGWPAEVVSAVHSFIYLHGQGQLNPVYLPDELLNASLSDAQASAIRQIREAAGYNLSMFSRVSGIQFDEFSNYGIGPEFRVTVTTDDSLVSLTQDMRVSPYAAAPFTILLSSRRVGD